jgi:hypothetical protein
MTGIDKKDFQFVFGHITDEYNRLYGGHVDLIRLSSDLATLSSAQLRAFKTAIKDGAKLHDLGHDLSGLANKETCFVPRIHVIAEAS